MSGKTKAVAVAHVRGDTCQTLEAHLRGVAERSKVFAEKIGLSSHGELIGLLHDLGKYSHEFQTYIQSATGLLNQDEDEEFVDAVGLKGKIDHSTAGAQWVWRELSQHGQLGRIVGQVLALCIASHHSGLIDCLTSDTTSLGQDSFGKRMSKSDARTHLVEALAKADEGVLDHAHQLVAMPDTMQALCAAIGKIVRTDPDKDDKSIIVQQQVGLLVRFLFSCLIDADRIDTADFECPARAALRWRGAYPAWCDLIERLERHLASLRPEHQIDHLRHDISRHCLEGASRAKGIYSLTVPTGGGKTLASLRFALHHAKTHGMSRIVYIIPFTSIIDQNAEVVRDILEPHGIEPGSVLLEHHSNLTPEQQTWRDKILSENWDAPVI